MQKFQAHPCDEGYVCREMDPEDGVSIEGVEIETPIWGGTILREYVHLWTDTPAGRVEAVVPARPKQDSEDEKERRNTVVIAAAEAGTEIKSTVFQYPAGYAGVNFVAGRHWVYMYIRDDHLRNYGLWMVRLVRDAIRMSVESGTTTLYALCDHTKPNATGFLKVLGFKPIPAMEKDRDLLAYEILMGDRKRQIWPKAWKLEAK